MRIVSILFATLVILAAVTSRATLQTQSNRIEHTAGAHAPSGHAVQRSDIPAGARVPSTPHYIPGRGHVQHTRPMIEGAKTPALIPDDVAYEFLFQMAVKKPSETPHRVRHLMRVLGNDEELQRILVSVASEFVVSDADFVRRIQAAARAQKPEQASTLKVERRERLRTSMRRLRDGLGPARATVVNDYVQDRLKRQISIIY